MQTNYARTMDRAFPGMKGDIRPDWVESYAAEGNIDFGICLSYGTDPENQVIIFNNENRVAGFSLHTHKEPHATIDGYVNTQTVNVIRKGILCVWFDADALGAPGKGDQVYAIPNTGIITGDANRGALIPGCTFHAAPFAFEGDPVAWIEVDMVGSGAALETIDNLDIEGLEPVAGEIPILAVDDEQWSAVVVWNEAMDGDGRFSPDEDYTCEITVTPKPGYTLDGIGENDWVVDDSDTSENDANSGVVDATWATTDATVTLFDLEAIVITPVKEVAAILVVDEAQYEGTITWDPVADGGIGDDEFEASTIYEATVELTAKDGFTFYGVAADDFIHAEAVAINNNANSGRVVMTFPETAA